MERETGIEPATSSFGKLRRDEYRRMKEMR